MNLLFKWLIVAVIVLIICMGNQISPQAELSNINVADCIEKPELCAQEQPEEVEDVKLDPEKAAAPVGIGFMDVLRMIAALAFVVALLYFLLRFINKKSRSYQENNTVRHLGGTALGGSRSVQVIKIGKRIFVLGVGEDVSLLKEIEDPVECAEMLNRYEEQSEIMIQPMDVVNKMKPNWMGRKKPKDSADFKQEFERKIEELKKSREQAIQDLKDREHN